MTLRVDALHGNVEIFCVLLKADEVAVLTQGGNGCSATTHHAVVQYQIAGVCVSADKILEQGDGLLGGVEFVLVTLEL